MEIIDIFYNGIENQKETIIKTVHGAIDNTQHKIGIVNLLHSFVENYEFDEINKEVIRKLFNYFIGDKLFCDENGINLNKGILLVGGVGTGKSLLMQVFKLYTSKINRANSFQSFTASEIVDKVNILGVESLEPFNSQMTCYIDDIGSQNEMVKNYGTDISVIEQLISIRYNMYSRYRKLTHFSTNVYPCDMGKLYDVRVIDRLIEMCNVIELPGVSKRK